MKTVTADTITADQIREARDRWPEHITAETSANALGLPEERTTGGLPIYPPPSEMWHARNSIAILINDPPSEHEGNAP